jgi:hypothetical protein
LAFDSERNNEVVVPSWALVMKVVAGAQFRILREGLSLINTSKSGIYPSAGCPLNLWYLSQPIQETAWEERVVRVLHLSQGAKEQNLVFVY